MVSHTAVQSKNLVLSYNETAFVKVMRNTAWTTSDPSLVLMEFFPKPSVMSLAAVVLNDTCC